MANTNRRQLLTGAAAYAAGAAIVAGGAALAGESKGASSDVSPELTKLLAEYQRRDALLGTWYETVWNTTTDALRADLAVEHIIPAQRSGAMALASGASRHSGAPAPRSFTSPRP